MSITFFVILRKRRKLITTYLSMSARVFLRASTFRARRLAVESRGFWRREMRWCIFYRCFSQLTSRGKGRWKAGISIDAIDEPVGRVRSIFDTSGQKPHDCGCNIDDVSPDNRVNVHTSWTLPSVIMLSRRKRIFASITIIGSRRRLL